MLSVVLFTAFAFVLTAALLLIWRQRSLADERAARNEERAAVAEAVHAVSHDVDNLFGVLLGNLSTAHDMPASEVAEMLADLEPAARAAKDLFHSLRGGAGTSSVESFATIVRVLVGMQRRRGVAVTLTIDGDLEYVGRPGHGFRIMYNLLENAAREIHGVPGAEVDVHLGREALRVKNPLRPGHRLDEQLFERGVSSYGSSGMGLANVREAATEIGLVVTHEVVDGAITFVVAAAQPPAHPS